MGTNQNIIKESIEKGYELTVIISFEVLECLGWELSEYYENAYDLELSKRRDENYESEYESLDNESLYEEIEAEIKSNFEIEVTVNEDGQTFCALYGGNEVYESEETGDDEMTIDDLKSLDENQISYAQSF